MTSIPRRGAAHDEPFTFDDLIDLHFLLQADELFLTLMKATLCEGTDRESPLVARPVTAR